ncbi:MAG: citrate transporter [Clostridia bacterium]|nr:citrate transporter [Clostridia bacterium]
MKFIAFSHDRVHLHGHPHPETPAHPSPVVAFIKKNTVLVIALAAAIITMFIVPPDAEYLGYFDVKTLTCLFCVLAVVCAFKDINFFYILARAIAGKFKNIRLCILAVIYITFIGSMLIANDMALLTFLPLGYFVLTGTGNQRYTAITFILQNIAANLGGMLTPFGNPQNLYLYTKFEIPTGEFMSIMALPFAVSILIITLCCFFIKPTPIEFPAEDIVPLPKGKTVVYSLLFVLAIAIVFRGVPYWLGLIIIPVVLFFVDRHALAMVDYPLLATFAAFFVFSGNMARIGVVRDFVSALLEKNTLIFSILSCQFISNVPSAILLSQFTDNYRALLVGVNIGGVGTLIASLASLITFREYTKNYPARTKSYILLFLAVNFAFLLVLTVIMSIALMG